MHSKLASIRLVTDTNVGGHGYIHIAQYSETNKLYNAHARSIHRKPKKPFLNKDKRAGQDNVK